jgi:cellulose synthase/poly-beta-1,6-N-acetylglucosamine synthase-like glycosyltransferase
MIISKLIFWVCLFFIFYGYLGYPILIKLISQIKPKPVKRSYYEPSVTLLIPAYNEERIIGEKIENSLSLDYPKDKLEIVIASDGSTDNTCQVAKGYLPLGVRLLEYREHQGKFSLLNKSAPQAKGEIIIFSDAAGMLNQQAIRELVANFNDPKVGCVCGLYNMIAETYSLSAKGYLTYLDYDIEIKKAESRFGSILGAHGAFYAIRGELFEPLPDDLINDDFYIPMKVVAKGYRAVYEEKAVVSDKMGYTFKEEFRRRVRIGFGNWQQIFALGRFLKLSQGWLLWQFFSHKISRTLMPFFIILDFILSILLKGTIYKLFFWLFILLLILAILCAILEWKRVSAKFIYIPFFWIAGNIAYLVGTIKFLFGKKKVGW